ncbi:MAG: hypothetical protein FWE07_05175 [Turicibacter sp.]|nr:hypothetical protein [Turicibacter sp.]
MMKTEKSKVLLGVLILIGLFALGYVGINRIAFATSGTEAILGLRHSSVGEPVVALQAELQTEPIEEPDPVLEQQEPIFRITETADDEHPVHFPYSILRPMEDRYITRYEAEVTVAAFLYERLGMRVAPETLIFGLTQQISTFTNRLWFTSVVDDQDGRIHNVAVDVITGGVVLFETWHEALEAVAEVEHNGISFVIDDWRHPMLGPVNGRYWQPYMVDQVNAAVIAADFIYEELGITMAGLRLQLSFERNPDDQSRWEWRAWTVPCWETRNFSTLNVWFNLSIDAVTGEVLRYHDASADW